MEPIERKPEKSRVVHSSAWMKATIKGIAQMLLLIQEINETSEIMKEFLDEYEQVSTAIKNMKPRVN